MKASPRVSIVVDNYNYARFLTGAIESALAQTYENCEVIVVDDGSTDDSRDVIASFGDRVRSVLKRNGGQASAFNAGYRESRGDMVAFLDADDRLHPRAMDVVVSKWQDDASKAHFLLQTIDGEGGSLGPYAVPGALGEAEVPLARGDVWPVLVSFGYYPTVPASGNVYARRLLEEVLPIPEEDFRICADSYLDTFAAALGQIVAIDETLGCYRIHDANLFYRENREELSRAALVPACRSLGHLRDAIVSGRLPGRQRDALRIQQLLAHFGRRTRGECGVSLTEAALLGLRLSARVQIPARVRTLYAGLFLGHLIFGHVPGSLRWWTSSAGSRFTRWYKSLG